MNRFPRRVPALIFLACAVLPVASAGAQTAVDPNKVVCIYDGKLAPRVLAELDRSSAFSQEIDTILNAVSLNRPPNLFVLAGSVENAAATLDKDFDPPRRVILYNQQFFALLPHTVGPFGQYAVLAHEMGHHLNLHPDHQGQGLLRELQADRFAGRVLAILGATLEETTAVLTKVEQGGSSTHPNVGQRRAAMVNGWIQQNPNQLAGPAVQVRLSKLGEDGVQRHPGDFVVDGTVVINDRALIADRILFRKDARLVFSQAALARSNTFYLVAREIGSEPDGPGTISWERPAAPPIPGSPGQAASGRHGQSEGEGGAPGQAGQAGAGGYSGDDAPALILAVQSMSSKLLIDLEGHGGGTGSAGQKGGDGGNGQRGSHASQNFFNCNRGPGDGGAGGLGGAGGPGGAGGRGGRGGTLTLLADASLLPSIQKHIQINVNGGEGGPAGAGGPSGTGGLGGPRGAPALPWCQDDGRDGGPGNPGPSGSPGVPGQRGTDGQFAVGVLAQEQLHTLLTP